MSIHLRWRKYQNGTEKAYLDIYEDGRRRKKYLDIKIKKNDTDKREKRALAEAIRTKYHDAQMSRQWDLVNPEKFNTPFLEYCNLFLANYNKAGIRKYTAAINSFETFLVSYDHSKTITCREITPSLCEQFRDYLVHDAGFKGETPYDYFKRFTAVLNKATRDRFFIHSPVKEISLPKPQSDVKKQILTIEEIQTLIDTDYGNQEVRKAFLFACFTGLGEKEIRTIKWANVANGRLNFERAKNGRKVSFKLPETALKILGKYGRSNDLIFDLPSNHRVWKILQKWVQKAGIDKHISFYCARHSFAVMNLKNGANLKTIQDLLGHSTINNTVKYLNYIDEEKDNAMDNLPGLDIDKVD